MIINNLEHQIAKTKKIKKAFQGTLSVGLSGVIISGGVLIYSGMKEYEIETEFGSPDYYGYEIITGEAKEDLKYRIFDYYEENIDEKMGEPDEIQVASSYNPNLPDDTILEIDSSTVKSIMWSLYDDPDYKGFVTIGDLKQLQYLDSIYSITVYKGDDISWLNYCENLKALRLDISEYESLESFKGIQCLNVHTLIVAAYELYNDAGVVVDEEYFSFLKNCPNIRNIEFETSVFSLTSPFLKDAINKNNDVTLMLNMFTADNQKMDVDTLLNFKNIQFDPVFSDGLYDIATVFTREDIDKLLEHGIELQIFLTNHYTRDTRINQKEFLPELYKIYDQIDQIIANLNITEDMSEEEKIRKVVKFVVENLKYSESSSEIQERVGDEGITPNMLGRQNEELVNDLRENSYKRGYLYGALDPNGNPVCGSYSALTNILLHKLRVETYRVQSAVHAWNLVNVDGNYYFLDTTAIDTSKDIINLDEYLAENQHLITPIAARGRSYNTELEPAGVNIYELSDERIEEITVNALKKYTVIFNGEIFSLSISSLMVLLSILGLAISNEKLYYLKSLERQKNHILYESDIEGSKQLEIIKAMYKGAKSYWRMSSPTEKMLLKASGVFDLEEFKKEIALLESKEIDLTKNKR